MDKKCVIIEEKETAMAMASKIDTAKEAEKSTVRSLTLKGVPTDSIPSFQEISRPIYTDPSKNFEKLSEYLIERITKLTMKNMKRLCKKRSVSLDLDYWRHYTVKLLSSSSTEVTIIVPSPAGSGKSTWIEAFTSAISELFLSELKMSYAIVGVVVVLQKVEDLNRLAATLNSDFSSNNPMMVSLQGWTLSGQQEGFCRNTGVKCFEDCLPVSCPFATSCELRTFQSKALVAPILGLTQERFCMLRSSNNLDSVFYRTMENGQFLPRRFLIFDEKYEMAEINTLDKNILDEASIEITKLIPKLSVTDRFVMGLQKEMSYFIEWPYQKIRGKLHISTQDGVQDLQAGFCSLDDLEICQDIQYAKFRSFVLEHKRKYSSKQLREAFSVMDGLYAGEKCLFSKTNGFSITRILPPKVHFGQTQTIIFDATAQIDDDYRTLEHIQVLSDVPHREVCQVEFHIYTHKDLNVSKQAMKKPWKIHAFSKLITELAEKEDMFVCTYKDYAEPFTAELEKVMSPEQFRHVLLMTNRGHLTLPYLGGTNGSNDFHTATQVFMLGYPRLNPRDYLIRTCAAYGPEQLVQEFASVPLETLASPNLDLSSLLPSMQQYIAHHLAARLEQEIYRCALRDPGFTGCIKVFLFCPPPNALHILLHRIPGTIIQYDDLPSCVELSKATARQYDNGNTSFARLALFLKDWDGAAISPISIQTQLGISKSVWKDLMSDSRVCKMFEQYSVERSGRGPNTKLYIANRVCA